MKSSKYIKDSIVKATIKKLVSNYGESEKERINKGVKQVALFWKKKDGTADDFQNFCINNFYCGEKLEKLFNKLQRNYEILWGHLNKLTVLLMEPIHLQNDIIEPIDMMFGSYSAYAHLEEDFYANKIAFVVLLNFPHYSLKEKNKSGLNWNAKQWAYARLGDIYVSRVNPKLNQKLNEISTQTDAYISEYNIYMGKIIDNNNNTYFPENLKLISHWGLRDQIKALYAEENSLHKQRIIFQIMNRIITQEIPVEVINSNKYKWNPFTNKCYDDNNQEVKFNPEKNRRYEYLKKYFNILSKIDSYYPEYKNYIYRHFEGEMQMTQESIEQLFIEYVSSPVLSDIARLIEKRLNRPLEPFDLWYDGFKTRNTISEEELNKKVRDKYPSVEDFQKGIADILRFFDFNEEDCSFIASKIKVDNSRGAGHAWGAAMKEDVSRLRTRANDDGMDYKSFNVAMHELGHNVEQTISLHKVPYYFLNGVPNTAFTEALAFMFQKRDLALLGISNTNDKKEDLDILDLAWSLYEIMGVGLVDMNIWKWMYKNKKASAEEIKQATIEISKKIWNKYYAPVFKINDEIILAIYSHIISYPLYVSAYPLGHLIEFQIEETIKNKKFGEEITRIFSTGNITPDVWLLKNTGSTLTGKFLLDKAKDVISKIS